MYRILHFTPPQAPLLSTFIFSPHVAIPYLLIANHSLEFLINHSIIHLLNKFY